MAWQSALIPVGFFAPAQGHRHPEWKTTIGGPYLTCYNASTGETNWAFPFISQSYRYPAPVVANGIVYVISGKVVNAYTTNGVFVRKYDTPTYYEAFTGQLIVTDDVLLVDGAYGAYVYNLADGRILQVINSLGPGNIYYAFAISLADNTLYLAGSDGNLYAYAATSAITLMSPRLSGGAFQFNSTNTPGASFSVLASTNVESAASNWTSLGQTTEISPGQYQFTDSQAVTNSRRFYRVSSP